MHKEAEHFKRDDEEQKNRIEAKNHFESYAYSIRNSIKEESVASKLDTSDRVALDNAVKDSISWLDQNQQATKEEYEDRMKQLENIVQPVMMKLYQGQGGNMPSTNASYNRAPEDKNYSPKVKISEVD